MNRIVLVMLVGAQWVSAQNAWTDRSRILPDKLRNIPNGLVLNHSPNPNYPEFTNEKNGPKYKWEHATCIVAMMPGLKVVEVGSFIWTENGWITNMSLKGKQFRQRFNSKKNLLDPGVTYCYEKNTRFGNTLYGGDALWFVLAEDEDGNSYKGIGIIETEGTLKN